MALSHTSFSELYFMLSPLEALVFRVGFEHHLRSQRLRGCLPGLGLTGPKRFANQRVLVWMVEEESDFGLLSSNGIFDNTEFDDLKAFELMDREFFVRVSRGGMIFKVHKTPVSMPATGAGVEEPLLAVLPGPLRRLLQVQQLPARLQSQQHRKPNGFELYPSSHSPWASPWLAVLWFALSMHSVQGTQNPELGSFKIRAPP